MKSVHTIETKQEVLLRIEKLSPESQRLWGKMSVGQMLGHIASQLKFALGDIEAKPMIPRFLMVPAKYVGGFWFNWPKNSPTAPQMVISNPKGFEEERKGFLETFERFTSKDIHSEWPIHPIFGKMTKEEWGMMAYKHINHHLKQFGV